MNRRGFLTTLLAVPLAGIKVNFPQPPMFHNAPLKASGVIDKNTLYFISQIELLVHNPRSIGRIEGINEIN